METEIVSKTMVHPYGELEEEKYLQERVFNCFSLRLMELRQINFLSVAGKKPDRICALVVRVPGYTTEMYCDSCEVRTEFIYVM
jgi:hypothetical protein